MFHKPRLTFTSRGLPVLYRGSIRLSTNHTTLAYDFMSAEIRNIIVGHTLTKLKDSLKDLGRLEPCADCDLMGANMTGWMEPDPEGRYLDREQVLTLIDQMLSER